MRGHVVELPVSCFAPQDEKNKVESEKQHAEEELRILHDSCEKQNEIHLQQINQQRQECDNDVAQFKGDTSSIVLYSNFLYIYIYVYTCNLFSVYYYKTILTNCSMLHSEKEKKKNNIKYDCFVMAL